MIVSVIGARGGTGKCCISRLIEHPSCEEIRAIVRTDDQTIPKNEKVKLVVGEFLTDEEKLAEVLQGSTHVIFAASGKTGEQVKTVDNQGVGICAQACKRALVKRLVLVSSQLVDPKNYWSPIRLFLNNIIVSGIMDSKV